MGSQTFVDGDLINQASFFAFLEDIAKGLFGSGCLYLMLHSDLQTLPSPRVPRHSFLITSKEVEEFPYTHDGFPFSFSKNGEASSFLSLSLGLSECSSLGEEVLSSSTRELTGGWQDMTVGMFRNADF